MHAFVILFMCSPLIRRWYWDFVRLDLLFPLSAHIAAPMVTLIILFSVFFSLWSRIQIKHDFSLTLKNFNCKMQFIHRTGRAITGQVRLFTLCRVQCCAEKNSAISSSCSAYRQWYWGTTKNGTLLIRTQLLCRGELNVGHWIGLLPPLNMFFRFFFSHSNMICACKNVCDTFHSIYGHLTCAEIKWIHCRLICCFAFAFACTRHNQNKQQRPQVFLFVHYFNCSTCQQNLFWSQCEMGEVCGGGQVSFFFAKWII